MESFTGETGDTLRNDFARCLERGTTMDRHSTDQSVSMYAMEFHHNNEDAKNKVKEAESAQRRTATALLWRLQQAPLRCECGLECTLGSVYVVTVCGKKGERHYIAPCARCHRVFELPPKYFDIHVIDIARQGGLFYEDSCLNIDIQVERILDRYLKHQKATELESARQKRLEDARQVLREAGELP